MFDEDGFDDPLDMVDVDQETTDAPVPTTGASALSDHDAYIKNNTVKVEENTNIGCGRTAIVAFLALVCVISLFSGNFISLIVWGGVLFWYLNRTTGVMVETVTRTVRFERFPCPRCYNDVVDIYDIGYPYFTCGGCGARGTYPFVNREDRKRRLGHRDLFFYKKVRTTREGTTV